MQYEEENYVQPSEKQEKSADLSAIKNTEILMLANPMEEILSRMRKQIESGEYRLIIGDDASGRIPALILNKVLSAFYQKLGYKSPQTIFFAGSRQIQKEGAEAKSKKVIDYFASRPDLLLGLSILKKMV